MITVSRGHLLITPGIDTRLNIAASLDYAHAPGDDILIVLGLFVRDEGTGEVLFDEFQFGGEGILEPPVGTLAFGGDIVLSADSLYRIDYLTRINTISEPDPQGPMDTSGLIHLSLEAIPEPSTLSLLAVGLLLTRRRWRLASH